MQLAIWHLTTFAVHIGTTHRKTTSKQRYFHGQKWFHYKPKWVKIRNMGISQSKTETKKVHFQGSYPVIGGSIILNDVSQNSTAINEI